VWSGRGLCDALITRPEESYRLWCAVVCGLETSRMRRPWPLGGCHATKKNIHIEVSVFGYYKIQVACQRLLTPWTRESTRFSASQRIPCSVCNRRVHYRVYMSPTRARCSTHLILFYLITRTILGDDYRSLNFSFCSFLHSPDAASLLGSSILLGTLFSNTFNLRLSI